MSFFLQPSRSPHSWLLVLVVVVIAIVGQMHRPYDTLIPDRSAASEQSALSPLQEARRADLESTVSGAIGIDESRGDSVSVVLVGPDR